jgi:hypothetical protein
MADQSHHLDSEMSPPSPDGFLEELEMDLRVIDVPDGEDDPSNSYGAPPPESNSEDDADESDAPPPTKKGLPWNQREAPTQVMALEALDALRPLLFVPTAPGKRKRNIETKINGWERKHLEEVSRFLHLYTGKESKTRGQWMESSVQVVAGRGGGTRYGAARKIRERARKFILDREVPVRSVFFGSSKHLTFSLGQSFRHMGKIETRNSS